jgi:hypothetical protein
MGKYISFLAVCQEKHPREVGGIKMLPWKVFLEMLWAGQFEV